MGILRKRMMGIKLKNSCVFCLFSLKYVFIANMSVFDFRQK